MTGLSGFLATPTALRLAAAALALGIFLFDALLPFEGAIAVLYVLVVLLAAGTAIRRDILAAAAAATLLTVIAYVGAHGLHHAGSSTLRAAVSLAAIAIATLLALRNQAATARLAAQARLLNLSHDMIFVRDAAGVITFWNRAAEETYGWLSSEAIGRVADDLLGTRYPTDRNAVEAQLRETGRWDGTLHQTTRSGSRLVLESRWAAQPAAPGQLPYVLETHTDITARQAAHAALVLSERRYRRMFDGSRVGVMQEDWSSLRAELDRLGLADDEGLSRHLARNPDFLVHARRLIRIDEVNPAFRAMAGCDDALGHALETLDDVLSGMDTTFAGALASFLRGDLFYEGETEIVGPQGRRVPVLFAITFPSAEDGDGAVLVFVVDIAERRQAQDALLTAQAELAHAARVATSGELTASIAHEVNQPLMAVVTSGEAALRWLRRDPPDPKEAEAALSRVASEGRRASEIVKRIRSFLTKAPAQRAEIAIAVLVEEALALVRHELERARVEIQVAVEPGLPTITGDRIQLQQVLVNLMVNAGQAMAEQVRERRLAVGASHAEEEIVIVVSDTGPGIAADHLDRLFAPFFTTRQQGMGMGLAICRTTAEAHGGGLSVESAPGQGATFRLVLPVSTQEISP